MGRDARRDAGADAERKGGAGHPLVDAHVHVWDTTRLEYPWLAGFPTLARPFLPHQIDRAGGATARMVFVQAGCRPDQAIAEVRWVAHLADSWPELAGIVADADLRSGGGLETQLDTMAAAAADAGSRRTVPVVGIRRLLQDEPPELIADAASRSALLSGMRVLAERGLTFDVCVRHPQLGAVTELLEQVPELPVVLDHLGKPPVDTGLDAAAGRTWADSIDRLARLPRAHVKLSGLAAEVSDAAPLEAHGQALLGHALRAFGPARSMIGSDWPVSAATGAAEGFPRWRQRVREAAIAADVDAGGIAAIEAGTAIRFYGLAV